MPNSLPYPAGQRPELTGAEFDPARSSVGVYYSLSYVTMLCGDIDAALRADLPQDSVKRISLLPIMKHKIHFTSDEERRYSGQSGAGDQRTLRGELLGLQEGLIREMPVEPQSMRQLSDTVERHYTQDSRVGEGEDAPSAYAALRVVGDFLKQMTGEDEQRFQDAYRKLMAGSSNYRGQKVLRYDVMRSGVDGLLKRAEARLVPDERAAAEADWQNVLGRANIDAYRDSLSEDELAAALQRWPEPSL